MCCRSTIGLLLYGTWKGRGHSLNQVNTLIGLAKKKCLVVYTNGVMFLPQLRGKMNTGRSTLTALLRDTIMPYGNSRWGCFVGSDIYHVAGSFLSLSLSFLMMWKTTENKSRKRMWCSGVSATVPPFCCRA